MARDEYRRDKPPTLQDQFLNFAKFGNTDATIVVEKITLRKSDFWMKQAKILDNKKVRLTDTGIAFSKFKASAINFENYEEFLAILAEEKELDLKEIREKMQLCGAPGMKPSP